MWLANAYATDGFAGAGAVANGRQSDCGFLGSLGMIRPMNTARSEIDRGEIAAFCRRHRIRRLALFGSVLRDDFASDSDVDVLVVFEPGAKTGLAFFDMQDELAGIIGRKVDLNTPGFLSPHFRSQVLREAKDLYVAA